MFVKFPGPGLSFTVRPQQPPGALTMRSQHFGAVVLLLSFGLGGYSSVSSIDVTDLKQSKCRFAGVDLVEHQDSSKKFNYTTAESVCQALGLQLASKAQVEKAHGYGYETCNFGWVLEKYGVIPRIQNNKNCGQNKTGVLTWKADLKQAFTAYCFNASDTRINSCKPELMVTPPQSTVVVPTTGSNMASTDLKTETTDFKTEAPTLRSLTTWPPARTTSLYTTLMTSVPPTTRDTTPMMTTDQTQKQENPMPQRNERVAFGGLPTTLLILALLFFIVAVVLAVCYIKKYKTHLFFTTKKEKRESVEAKVFKDTSGAENTREDERLTNGKESENRRKPSGNSVEAEV